MFMIMYLREALSNEVYPRQALVHNENCTQAPAYEETSSIMDRK